LFLDKRAALFSRTCIALFTSPQHHRHYDYYDYNVPPCNDLKKLALARAPTASSCQCNTLWKRRHHGYSTSCYRG